MRTYTETNFEDHIEERLNQSGYRSLLPADYDKYACLIPEELLRFIRDSQPEEYRKLEYQHGNCLVQFVRVAKSVQHCAQLLTTEDSTHHYDEYKGTTVNCSYSRIGS